MMKTQMDYMTGLADLIEESYLASINAGKQIQNEFAKNVKEIVEFNLTNTLSMQHEAAKFGKQWIEMTTKNVDEVKSVMDETYRKSLDMLNTTFDVANRKDLDAIKAKTEDIWKKTFSFYNQELESLKEKMEHNFEKTLDVMSNYVGSANRQEVDELNSKLEALTRKVETLTGKKKHE